MTNEQIAKILAELAYKNNDSDEDFAVQLFIEEMVLPEHVEDYSEKSMEEYILAKLEETR